MTRVLFIAAALIAVAGIVDPAAAQRTPPSHVVLRGLEEPTGIAFNDAGDMYINERAGRVRVVRDGVLASRPVATIPTTVAGESGLLGIAIPPDEREYPFAYVFATAPDGGSNSVARIPLDGGEPTAVVEDLPAGGYHNGGGVTFDARGMLYVSNGEQHVDERAQDPAALGGKVYRFEPDGDIPVDNPFGDPPSPTYALGLRNPFGIAIDPVSGDPFVTENGPTNDDEINRIVAGGNYGWPRIQGSEGEAGDLPGTYRPPLVNFSDIIVPTGIAFADPAEARPPYRGDLFFGTFGEETIHRVRLNGSRDAAVSDEIFLDVGEPVYALAWGPEGLYFSTQDDVRLIPMAERADAARSPPPPIDAPPPDDGDEGSLAWTLVIVAVLVGVVVAALLSLLSSRRAP